MSDIAVGISDVLVAAGVGTFGATVGWGIFIHQEPPSPPDTAITIYETGGTDPNPKWLLDFPSVQVRVRGAKGGYVAAKAKATDVLNALLGLPSQTINSDVWVAVNQVGGINSLGQDDKDRPLFSLNYGLIIEPATGTNRIAFP